MILTVLSLVFDFFCLIAGACIIIFGGVAFVSFLYSKFTNQPFKRIYSSALEKTLAFLKELFKNDDDENTINANDFYEMKKERIFPLEKAINDNGIKCICENAVCNNFVAFYRFLLAKEKKEEDINFEYLEILLKKVYYKEIIPLYQGASVIPFEWLQIYIQHQGLYFNVYVTHSREGYKYIDSLKKNDLKGKYEALKGDGKEMIE